MDNRFAKLAFAAVAASMITAAPAQAAACWNTEQANAMRIKDFQSKMMVATLRCNAMGHDRSSNYNRFILTNKPALTGANLAVKARFKKAYGAKWQTEYDRFNTSLANTYGGDATNAAVCENVAQLTRDAVSANGNSVKLLAVAERSGGSPKLPGGICPRSIALL